MPQRLSPQALCVGRRNALVCATTIILPLWLLTAYIIHWAFGLPLRISFSVTPLAILILCSVWGLLAWLRRMLNSGEILLDCGPLIPKIYLLIPCGMSLFCVVHSSEVFGPARISWTVVFAIMVLGFWVLSAFERFQIRRDGIWFGSNLLKWRNLVSYHWEGDDACTLIVRRRSVFPWFGLGAFTLDPMYKNEVDTLLTKYYSQN